MDSLDIARATLEEGRFEDALEILHDLLEENPDEPEVQVLTGIAYVQTEQPKKAVEILRRAEEQVEDHCILCLFLGRALKALGRLSEAEGCLRRAVSLEPDASEAWEDLANILFEQKEYGLAVQVLNSGIRHFPENASLRGLSAICYHRLGDYTSAEREWSIVVQLRPHSIMALSNLAYMLVLQERYDEVGKLVDRIEDTDDWRYQLLKGEMMFRSSNYETAIDYLMNALSHDAGSIQSLSRLVIIHDILGHKRKSVEYLNQIEEQIGKHPQCWRGLISVYRYLSDDDKILETLLQGTKFDRGSAAPWTLLAQEYRKRGMIKESIEAWIVSFELRGYVKIHCTTCENYFTLPYHRNVKFNPNRRQSCPYCISDVSMPDGLATI